MKKSFYHYVQKYRGGGFRKKWTSFANDLFQDSAFPKQSIQYHEISEYLEMHQYTNDTLQIFDEIWDMYEIEEG